MATYAMICDNKLIDVVHDCEKAPNWPPDPDDNLVTAIECVPEATRDWEYNPETGEITEPIHTTPVEPTPEPLTESEERQIDILLNTEYIACLLESQLV